MALQNAFQSSHSVKIATVDISPSSLKRIYSLCIIAVSRGIGSIIITLCFLIKKLNVPADEFASLGHAFATVTLLISPVLSPALMIISRRIIKSQDIGQDRMLLLAYATSTFLAAVFVFAYKISYGNSIPDMIFILSLFSFVLVTVINAQYIIWLSESNQIGRSMIFITIFLISLPISIGIREITDIGQRDRTFAVETLLLSMPVLFDLIKRRKNKDRPDVNLYKFSSENYGKYFCVAAFYVLILWADWTLGRDVLIKSDYVRWAEVRIIFERILLPVLSIVQVTLLWELLRRSTRGEPDLVKPISQSQTRTFQQSLAIVAFLTLALWFLPGASFTSSIIPLAIGYIAYGLASIFLDFYQAKYGLWKVVWTLGMLLLVRTAVVICATLAGGVEGYAVSWAVTSIAILAFLFHRARDQIRI